MIQRISNHQQKDAKQSLTHRKAWNRLWRRSGNALPFCRWECLHAFQQEPNSGDNRMLRVERKCAATIGISLKADRRFGFRFFRSNNSAWTQAGQLLIDRAKVTTGCFESIVKQMKSLPVDFVFLDWATETVDSHRLDDALRQNGMAVSKQLQFKSGLIRLKVDSFDEYFAGLSKTFRKKVRSNMRKLLLVDDVQYHCLSKFKIDDQGKVRTKVDGRALTTVLQSFFDVEHLGWKGQEGSSINANLDERLRMQVYCTEAAKSGSLQLHYLTVGDKVVAFDIGFSNDDTYFSYKVSYDPQFASYSPGQLLTYEQLQYWFEDDSIKLVDTLGELSVATEKWCNDSVERHQYLISTGSWWSNLVVKGYSKGKPLLKKLLRRE